MNPVLRTAVARALNPTRASAVISLPPQATDWQVAPGYYVPAVQQMQIIHPRPDLETAADEMHRRWPTGKDFRYSVNVLGGSRQLNYALTVAPAGMTINQEGEIVWPSANLVIGTHTVTIRVRTQEFGRNTSGLLDEVTRSFTLTILDRETTVGGFVWVDSANGSDSNDGSFSNPVRTLPEVFENSTYAERQCHLVDGTYSTNGSARLEAGGTRPKGFIGSFTTGCRVDWVTEGMGLNSAGVSFAGFEGYEAGYGASANNARYFIARPTADRAKFYRVNMFNVRPGTSADDNPTTIYANGEGAGREYWGISHCSETGRTGGTSFFSLYRVNLGVYEYNTLTNSLTAGEGFFLKDSNTDWTGANNDASGSGVRSFGTFCQQQAYDTERIEICYNKSGGDSRYNGQFVLSTGVHWIYRNNFDGIIFIARSDEANTGPYNVFANASTGAVTTGSRVNETQSELHNVSAIFDSNINLTGSARTNWLGRRGAEWSDAA